MPAPPHSLAMDAPGRRVWRLADGDGPGGQPKIPGGTGGGTTLLRASRALPLRGSASVGPARRPGPDLHRSAAVWLFALGLVLSGALHAGLLSLMLGEREGAQAAGDLGAMRVTLVAPPPAPTPLPADALKAPEQVTPPEPAPEATPAVRPEQALATHDPGRRLIQQAPDHLPVPDVVTPGRTLAADAMTKAPVAAPPTADSAALLTNNSHAPAPSVGSVRPSSGTADSAPKVEPTAVQPGARPQERPARKPAPPQKMAPSQKAAGSGGGLSAGASGKSASPEAGAGAASRRATWGAAIARLIEERKRYPLAAGGATGRSGVVLDLGSDGRLLSVAVSQPSGNAALDLAALDAVRNAAPFPPAPEGIGAAPFTFSLTMAFRR